MKHINFKIWLFTFIGYMFFLPVFAQKDLAPISKNKNAFYIPGDVLKKYGLKLGQDDGFMRVYNNLSDIAPIQRVNDLRWQAKNQGQALKWYSDQHKMLSENGDEITLQITKPKGLDCWNIYTSNLGYKKLMKGLGLEGSFFIFTFTCNKYVGKIFVATGGSQTVHDAWKLANEGIQATLKAMLPNR